MKPISLTIDSVPVDSFAGQSVLEAALGAGIYIPHLCHHPDLPALGACRLCVVEIEGLATASTACTSQVESGMVVRTRTPELEAIRRLALELMMAGHPSDCTSCPKYLKCELQSLTQYLGVSAERLRRRPRSYSVITDNPLFLRDRGRCILCGRCVRVCRDLRGVNVLTYNQQNGDTYIGPPLDALLADADCRFCGACVEVCPTGALRDKEGLINPSLGRAAALVPCRAACPAGIDIPRYIRLIREKKYSEAVAVIREKAPFPLVLGYVCSHICQAACRRAELNEAISIKDLKRFAAERDSGLWKSNSKRLPSSDRSVAVVGAGPAGLTGAYYLAKQGYRVTVFDSMPAPGGQLRWGIPEHRLPTAVLETEIEHILGVGVEIKTNTTIESLEALLAESYHAVLVATGTHQGVKLPIPGSDLDGVLLNTSFLRDARLGNRMTVGARVVVLGGGNVAFDCARVALRLGAKEVHLACLEPHDGMLASSEEIAQGEEEGIIIHPAHAFVQIIGDQGHVTGMELLDVHSFTFDAERRAHVETIPGSEHVLLADTVIFAIGQRPSIPANFDLMIGRGNTIQVDPDLLMTNRAGVFAAGDAVNGTCSVIEAIAAGRKAAIAIDKFLGGDGLMDEVLVQAVDPDPLIGRIEGFAALPRCSMPLSPAADRIQGFGLTETGYDEAVASQESNRCLQCDLRANLALPRFWGDFTSRK